MKTLTLLTSIALVASAIADDTAQQKLQAQNRINTALIKLRQAEAGGNAGNIAEAKQNLARAELIYRGATREHYLSSMRGVNEDGQKRYVYHNKAENTRRRIDFTNALVGSAENRKDMTADQRAAFLANNEAALRAMMIDNAVNESFVREFRPVEDRTYKGHTAFDKRVDAKTARMSELLRNIESTDYNTSYGHKGFAAEVDQMAKRVQVEHNLEEYRSLANSRNFRSPSSGELLTPTQQSKVGANAMKVLESSVKRRAHDGGIPEDFVNFFTGEKKDSRLALAGQLSYENKSNIASQALKHVEGKNATPQEHFRAMSQVIHQRANELDDYFTNEYLPNANDGKDSTVSQWANLGMGTAMRSIFENSEEGVGTVRRKIDAVKADGYKVAALLNEAATTNANNLTAKDRDLLINYGYVKKEADGKYSYQVPQSNRDINQVMDVNLPKSPWMDVVSVRSAGETGLAMATGAGSARFAQALANAGNLGAKGTAALATLTEVTASSGMDSLMNVAHGKDADFDKALLHNLTMAGVGKLTGAAGDEFLNSNKSWRDALENSGNNTVFRELMGATKDGEKILRSDQMKRFIANSVGLTSEAAIETAYQAAADGGPLDKDAFMANLFSGAMSKTASSVMHGGGEVTAEKVIERLPESVRQWAIDNPKAVLASIERARKSEAHAQEAVDRFDAVKRRVAEGGEGTGLLGKPENSAEVYRNPAMADHIMDSLKNGDLRWGDLGIIAEKEGKVVADLLNEVKDRRTEWAYGVREPDSGVVLDKAKENVAADYDSRIADVRAGKGTAEDRALGVDGLQSERTAVLEQLGKGERDKNAAGVKAGKALSKAHGELFTKDVMENGVGQEVKDRAIRELNREYELKKQAAITGDGDASSKDIRLRQLEAERLAHEKSIKEAKMIAPGSSDPTSDIDRSWSEPRVVQAMKNLQRDRLMTESNGVKGVGPTTAKAFDLNEYYNVMDGVKAAMPLRNDAEKGFNNEKVDIEGVGTVSHDDAVAGNSLAAAMSHMSPERRELYKKNMLEKAGDDPVKKQQRETEIAIAERALEASEKRLSEARTKVAERFGLDPNSKEAGIYARDLVYGETMRDVKALDTQISKLEPGSPDWKKLQAQRERLMNQASRDGIEAYTDGAGLDVIVNRMQSKTREDGSKMSVNDLWNDPKFNRDGDLSHLSERQLDNMMNDQTMMISEHLDAYTEGGETPHQTARALAKYGQRAALVAKMNGADMPPGHPMRELYDATSKLIEHKGDPTAMRAELEKLAGPGGTYRDGLNKLKNMVENAVPGLKGYTGVPNSKPNPNVPKGFSSLSSYRDWLRTRDKLYERGGQQEVDRWLQDQRDAAEMNRAALQAEKADLEKLSEDYLPADFKQARRLQENLDAVMEQIEAMPKSLEASPEYLELLKQKADIERAMKALKDKKAAYEKEHGKLPKHPDLDQIDRELKALEEKAQALDDYLKNGTHPPKFDPPKVAGDGTDDLEKMIKEEETPKEKPVRRRRGGLAGALEDVADKIEGAGEEPKKDK
ncbi:hypothetical protein SAMN02745181_0614 [Rubritalea squalenifaciens DSM 18772]|uniref:Uncharacterized protein n=1 Tax=Rubritalea squalenifaciens DSM 18772 TaxID=1123071 RepID=A0A1M6D075_9BACT|nr:hypothetical protein [Rubritalea squalenifaciens]SHI66715.1 hypothetical protein SAMN02745181_0614 [Rubritalea squalenifaciens DSM 18772]